MVDKKELDYSKMAVCRTCGNREYRFRNDTQIDCSPWTEYQCLECIGEKIQETDGAYSPEEKQETYGGLL